MEAILKETINLTEFLIGKSGAFYGRVSTNAQDDQMQWDSCCTFTKKYKCTISKHYEEELSATRNTLTKRKKLMNLINDASKHKFDFIVVYNHDRLARDPLEHLKLRKMFDDIDMPVFLSSSEKVYSHKDILSNAIRDNYSKIESDNIRVRMKDSINSRIGIHGIWTGGHTPYGVQYISIDDNNPKIKNLVFEKNKIPSIEFIFEKYKQGYGFRAVANMLIENGMDIGTKWSKDKIKSIVTNPIYCGILSINKRKRNSTNTTNEREMWVEKKCNDLEPIISCNDWEYCYELYYKRKTQELKNPRQFTTNFLFKDLVYCHPCNKPLATKNQISQGIGSRIYFCSSCCKIRIIAKDLDHFLYEYLKNSILLKTSVGIKKDLNEYFNRKVFELEQGIKDFTKQLTQLRINFDDAERELKPLLLTQSNLIAIKTLQAYQSIVFLDIEQTKNNVKKSNDKIDKLKKLDLNDEIWDNILSSPIQNSYSNTNVLRKIFYHLIDKIEIDFYGGIEIVSKVDFESH